MPDMESVIRERELELAKQDQSYEAKLNTQLKPRIDALRVVGPAMPSLNDKYPGIIKRGNTDMAIADCRFCNPPPEPYKCIQCDWETTEKWKMALHNDLSPKWCRDRAARKVRKWSQHA